MRILWVKVGGLWPVTSGGRQRSFHMLSELARRHDLTVVTTHEAGDDPDGLLDALPAGTRVITCEYAAPKQGSAGFFASVARSWFGPLPVDLLRWRVPAVRRLVADAIAARQTDVIVADFLAAVPNVPDAGVIPIVCFSHNVEHLIWRRLWQIEQRPWRRAVLNLEWRKMRRIERHACERAALTVAVSVEDRDRLRAQAPGAAIVDVPTGVDLDYFHPSERDEVEGRLVFSGSMDWYPNEDAVLWFLADTWPLIRRQRPNVSFTIVGRRPSDRVRQAAEAAGVSVTGTVDDVRPHVLAGSVVVVPLRVGGGTRLKIFEALAMGKPVVSTTIGAEGLAVTAGEHLVLADGADALCTAVVDLLDDAARRRRIGRAGRALVDAHYGWQGVTAVFERHLADAVRRATVSALPTRRPEHLAEPG